MMEIDLEMPKCCSECPFDFENDCYKCGITGKICDGKKWNDERLSDCPLKKSVIDKIKAEIEEKYEKYKYLFDTDFMGTKDLEWVLSVIDKYRNEVSKEV